MTPILLYHKVTNFDVSGIWVTPNQFEQQMQYLYNQGYTTITPYELTQASDISRILITFDDGYGSFYHKALPVLLKYRFKAVIFVVSKYIGKQNWWDVNLGTRERHLNLEELREIKNYGFIIGSHTRTHQNLTKIPIQRAKEEILNSKYELEDKLADKVLFLSFPFGRYNNSIVELALEAGYKLTFTSNPFVEQYNIIGRIGVYIIDQLPQFKAKLHRNGIFYLAEARKAQIINFFSNGTWMWKTLNPFVKHSI